MRRSFLGFSLISLALAACGSTAATSGAGGGTTGSSGTPGAGGGSTTASTGTGPSTPQFKSYVILGDSISDGGGSGPFFNDLLVKNDDTKYPAWKGKDFKSKFGADLKIAKTSKGGAVAGDLLGQVKALPATLPGPVVVTITIGGNDMQVAIQNILGGQDQPDRDKFRANIKAALSELTKADRFGAGVQVVVYEADIYDPTDGQGDFGAQGCPFPLSLVPKTPSDKFFANWNAVVDDEVPKHGMSLVAPLHMTFYGHGVSHKDATGWFFNDCIHPNTTGHNEVRAMFWQAITGETVK